MTMTMAIATNFEALLECEQGPNSEDVVFFTEIASETGGPILELGCGTGRLAIPIARTGVDVVGLDISLNALKHFEEKLATEPIETRKRIRLLCSDMKHFSLNEGFRAAFCSSNSLFLLGSEDSVVEALACVRSHLAPHGTLVIDVAAVDLETRIALAEYPKGDLLDIELPEHTTEPWLRRSHSIKLKNNGAHIAKESQTPTCFSITYKYINASDGLCCTRSEDIVLFTPKELMRLIRKQGYEIVKRFGWYDRRRFSEKERKLIVLARKKE